MEDLNLPPTEITPWIRFCVTTGILEIGGKSYSSDAILFYKPVLDWIDAYIAHAAQKPTVLDVKLEQFDDDATKILLQIFQKINKIAQYQINWYYEDHHVLELGEDLSFMVGAHFNFIKIN